MSNYLAGEKKEDIYSTPRRSEKYPRRQAWAEAWILSTNGNSEEAPLKNQLKVKDLLVGGMI